MIGYVGLSAEFRGGDDVRRAIERVLPRKQNPFVRVEVEVTPSQFSKLFGKSFPCLHFVEGAEEHDPKALFMERLIARLYDIPQDVLSDAIEDTEDVGERVTGKNLIVCPGLRSACKTIAVHAMAFGHEDEEGVKDESGMAFLTCDIHDLGRGRLLPGHAWRKIDHDRARRWGSPLAGRRACARPSHGTGNLLKGSR